MDRPVNSNQGLLTYVQSLLVPDVQIRAGAVSATKRNRSSLSRVIFSEWELSHSQRYIDRATSMVNAARHPMLASTCRAVPNGVSYRLALCPASFNHPIRMGTTIIAGPSVRSRKPELLSLAAIDAIPSLGRARK